MDGLEEFCGSISDQLRYFIQKLETKHASILVPLETELSLFRAKNSSLQAELATVSVGACKPKKPKGVRTPREEPAYALLQLADAWKLPTTPQGPKSFRDPLGVSCPGRVDSARLKLLRANVNEHSDHQLETDDEKYVSERSFTIGCNTAVSECGTDIAPSRSIVSGHTAIFSEEAEDPRGSRSCSLQEWLSGLSLFSHHRSDELDGALANWWKLVAPLLNMSLLGLNLLNREKLENALLLRPAWETVKHQSAHRRSMMASWLDKPSAAVSNTLEITQEYVDSGIRASAWSRCIMHPESRWITLWALLGAFAILYDIMTFPLAGFDVEDTEVQIVVMWMTTILWTFDIVVSLLRGVHHKGYIEMRPYKIFLLYARSWLVIDLTMVSIDWLFIYLMTEEGGGLSGASKVFRSGKVIRAVRVVRAVRLIRTIKVLQTLRDVFENMKSEFLQLFIKLLVSIVCILLLSHYVTCAWFALAHFNTVDPKTWITVFLVSDPRPPLATEYASSMHFSLTQIAGSQNIVPQNARERLVASIIIVFDIVVFSTLVGIITDIMAQFRSLTYERNKEVGLIRQFFVRTEMDPVVEHRIWHFFRRHYRKKRSYVHASDIQFFKYLPSSLRMALDDHLYVPTLSKHPLFRLILEYDRFSMLAVCASAVSTTAPAAETEVFAEGDLAKWMFFVTSGQLLYRADDLGFEVFVEAGMWLSEVTLWTKWMHCGHLTCQCDCIMLRIEAETFEKTLQDRADTSEWFRYLQRYAAFFAQRMSDSFDTFKPMTDVDSNRNQAIEDMVQRAFPTALRQPLTSLSSHSLGMEIVKSSSIVSASAQSMAWMVRKLSSKL